MDALTSLIEYMKLHLISLEKYKESLDKEYTDSYDYVVNEGQIIATRHLLSVAADIIFIKTEEI